MIEDIYVNNLSVKKKALSVIVHPEFSVLDPNVVLRRRIIGVLDPTQ